MNSCDNLWYKGVGERPFRENCGIFNQNGERLTDLNHLSIDSVLIISKETMLKSDIPLNLKSIWVFENCRIETNLNINEDFRSRNNLTISGNIFSRNYYLGHNLSLNGNIIAKETIEIGNDSKIDGNIDCRVLKIGENAKINGYIRAEKIFAGSRFNSNGEITAIEFMTGENSSLLGNNNINYLYSQNGITLNGGVFIELHTDDNFKSFSSIKGKKLIMDNCAVIEGDAIAEEYIRVGDKSTITGNCICDDYLEFGPGTSFFGRKIFKREKQLPPSSMKIRENGKVYFKE